MIRAHKTRLHPTPEQAVYFRKACGVARFVYNYGLAEWKRHKAEQPDVTYGPMAIKKDFNAVKRELFPFVMEVAKDVAENAFANLAVAMSNYYANQKKVRQGATVGFPKFKSKKRSKQCFHLNNDKVKVRGNELYVPRLGWVNMAEPLRFSGKLVSITVSRQADWWFVSITVEVDPKDRVDPPAKTHSTGRRVVGIDLGLKTFALLSDGTRFESQKPLRQRLRQLKRLNRTLARRKQGTPSRRWWKARDRLTRCHYRVECQRGDFLHKISTQIAQGYDLIGIEDLHVAGMVRNRKLALSVSDASWGELVRQLEYKCAASGAVLVKVDRFFPSSRLCPACGAINSRLTLADREWVCECGAVHDRDLNAACNIRDEAIRLSGSILWIAKPGSGYVGLNARGPDVRVAPAQVGSLGGSEHLAVFTREH